MYHKILVGIDGTPGSWYALERAVADAAGSDAQIVALFVESPLWTPPTMGRPAFEKVVRRRAQRLAQRHRVPLEVRVRHGFPAHTLAEQARLLGCDLIVLGHAEDGLLRHWMTASVSRLLRHEAPCRVTVVRRGEMIDLDTAPAAVTAAWRGAVG